MGVVCLHKEHESLDVLALNHMNILCYPNEFETFFNAIMVFGKL
jgi:hypothetical protein